MRQSLQALLKKYGLTSADRLDRIEAAAMVESFVSPNWKDLICLIRYRAWHTGPC